jgi:hypothetical protein
MDIRYVVAGAFSEDICRIVHRTPSERREDAFCNDTDIPRRRSQPYQTGTKLREPRGVSDFAARTSKHGELGQFVMRERINASPVLGFILGIHREFIAAR